MIDPATFFKAMGIMLVYLLFVSAIGFVITYWLRFLIKKYDLAYKFKYKILKRKPTAEDETIIDMLSSDRPVSKSTFYKELLLSGSSKKRVDELYYIYQNLYNKELKGGYK